MTIYVFSLLVGYELSGVDTAQASRDSFFSKTMYERKYVFSQIPVEEYIERYINLGINIEDMLSVHLAVAGHNDFSGDYKVSERLKALEEIYGSIQTKKENRYLHIYSNGKKVETIYLKEDERFLWRVDLIESERLLVSEHYSDKLLFRDYYSTIIEGNRAYAKKTRTSFFDTNGNVAYECLYEDNSKEDIYAFNDGGRHNISGLIEMFIHKLKLNQDDIIIIDRPSRLEYVQPLFKAQHNARIMPFLHSNHYFEPNESISGLYLNHEYYYWFKYSNRIDTFIVSTEGQKKELKETLEKYGCYVPNIQAIFTGGLKEIIKPASPRKKCSIITASRLVGGKKIDWIIWAVIKAHKHNPLVNIDIYGSGTPQYTSYLKEIITSNNAESYINLKGFDKVDELYKEYEIYISASITETLGLSIMEAIGSGNAVIGLDVRYGNRHFIEHNKNGKLIDYDIHDPEYINRVDEITTNMANAIVELFGDEEKLEQYREHSYEIAKKYLNENIEKQWVEFLEKNK